MQFKVTEKEMIKSSYHWNGKGDFFLEGEPVEEEDCDYCCEDFNHTCTEHSPEDDKYNELILAVGNKYEGETRHETALRYIKNAEESIEQKHHHNFDSRGICIECSPQLKKEDTGGHHCIDGNCNCLAPCVEYIEEIELKGDLFDQTNSFKEKLNEVITAVNKFNA